LIESILVDNSTVNPVDCVLEINDKIVCFGVNEKGAYFIFPIGEKRIYQ